MPTDIPIRVAFPRSVWRVAETTEYEIAEALKHMLLLSKVSERARSDVIWLLQELGEFSAELCTRTEIHYFCILKKLSDIADELVKSNEDRDVQD